MQDLLDELEDWNNGHKARSVSISIDNGYGATCWTVVLHNEKQTIVAEETSFFELHSQDGNIGSIPYWNGKDKSLVVFVVNEEQFKGWPGLKPVLRLALDVAYALGLKPLSKKT